MPQHGGKAQFGPAILDQPLPAEGPGGQKIEMLQLKEIGANTNTPARLLSWAVVEQNVAKGGQNTLAAKLHSMRPVQFAGIALLILWIATLTPWGSVIIGNSVTARLVMLAAALVLIFGPTLIVGHELLLLVVAIGVVLVYIIAHRHGEHKAKAEL